MRHGKNLIIDGQIFQTEAKDRGMGRYSVCLVQALAESNSYDTIEILLTKNLPHKDSYIAELQQLFGEVTLKLLDLKIVRKGAIKHAAKHNQIELNKYVSGRSEKGDTDYLMLSLFQEPTVSVFPDEVKKLLVMYDLIPYLYHERYEPIMQYQNYLHRFKYIFEADGIFSISQSVADDLHTYLGVPNQKLICIDGAPIRTNHITTKPTYNEVPEKFVLMPTSDDVRKNNLRAVLGFEEYCSSNKQEQLKLVITSKIRKRERDHLSMFSDRLVFTGNLDDTELNWLYERCEAVLFTPESEGLGLPILEAVEVGKKVICSSIPVFKEISKDGFCYCDSKNQHSIALALYKALNTDYVVNGQQYEAILKHYSWAETAKRFVKGAETIVKHKANLNLPKIAIFAPRQSGFSAIGKVVAELHPTLSKYFMIDYYIEHGLHAKHVRPDYLPYVANCFRATDFSVKKYTQYDAVVYHIGNGDYHLESIKNGLYLPGYSIVHDTNIGEAFRVLVECEMMSPDRAELEKELDSKFDVKKSSYMTSLLSNQLGVITHSEYAKQATREVVDPRVPVKLVNLPSAVAKLDPDTANTSLVIGLAGIIADVKGIEVVELIANDPQYKNCEIVLFGFNYATQDTIDRLNFYENVTVMTDLTDFEFQENLRRLDIFVNFRLEYKGETSLSTIEAMKNGVVVIVRDIGWYSELPNDVVIKVTNQKQVLSKLMMLQQDSAQLKQLAARAKEYIAHEFSHEQFAQGLLTIIKLPLQPSKRSLIKAIKDHKIKTSKQYLQGVKRYHDD